MAKKPNPASATESSGHAKSRRRSGGPSVPGGSTSTADQATSNLPPLAKIQGFVIVTIPRSQIKNAAYNPRVISPAQRRKLTASLKKFRLVEPLVWNFRTGNLVGGHQRLTVIDALEGTADYSLTVARIDVDEATEKALNIALNNPESQGQYDMDLLADVIRDLHVEDKALIQDAGFDASNLSMLFGDSFLTGQAAEQAAADAPLVDELSQMYEAGAEEEKKRKAALSAQKNAQPKGTGSPDPGSSGSPDSPDSPDSSHHPDTDPSDENLPSGDSQSSADEPKRYGKAGWTKEDFKARRDEYRNQRSTLDDASVHLTIVFDSSDQLGSFLGQLGLDPNLDMIDAFTILPLLGVDMDDGDGEEGDGEEGDGEEGGQDGDEQGSGDS